MYLKILDANRNSYTIQNLNLIVKESLNFSSSALYYIKIDGNVIFHIIFFILHRQERDLMTRTDRFGVEVRERIMWDIREGVVGADTFVPKHVVFVTWKNMSFAGGIDISLYRVSKI